MAVELLEPRLVLAAPVANSGSGSIHMYSMLMSSVSVSDDDFDSLTVSLIGGTGHGSLMLSADGSFMYTPDQNFVGEDSFSFQANDGTEDSGVATFAITVGNSSPTAINGGSELHMNSSMWASVSGSDPDSDWLTFSVVAEPTHGILSLNSDGYFSYTPNLNYVGEDSFQFQATDGAASSGIATYSITIGNSAPTVSDSSGILHMNGTLMSSVNVFDADMDALSVSLISRTPNQDTLWLNSDGSFIYMPTQNSTGSFWFSFQANDGASDSNVGQFTITVENTAPTSSEGTGTVHLGGTLMSSLSATDADADPLTFRLSGSYPPNGSLHLSDDGSFTYHPYSTFAGTDQFWFEATDGNGTSNISKFVITVENAAPIAVDGSASVDMNSMLMSSVSVSDPDMDWLTVGLVGSTTSHGSVILSADGSFMYIPDTDFVGTDSFSFQASDGNALSRIGLFTITVTDTTPIWPNVSIMGGGETPELELGATTAMFSVWLDEISSADVTVPWTVTVTGIHPAADGGDFVTMSGTATIPAGMISTLLDVVITGDAEVEYNEHFMVSLGTPTGANLGSISSASGTIVNDDCGPMPPPGGPPHWGFVGSDLNAHELSAEPQ